MRAGRAAIIILAAAAAVACGGGGATTPSPAPSATGDPTKLVGLDAGSFDALVLANERPSLVKFQSPT